MNLNNFVVDRIVRAVGKSKDDEVLFAINQVTNASLNVTSETAEAVDALGTPIAVFNRAKTAEFSAENALFDLNLMATQAGSKKISGSSDAPVVAPAFDVVEDGKLKHAPITDAEGTVVVKFYTVNGDGSLGAEIGVDDEGKSDGTITVEGQTVTGLPADVQVMAVYEFEAENAVAVINSATEFPKACELVLEVLGCDVCNQEELIYAYLIFPNFKISPDFDWSIATDGAHPFSGQAMQNYCDTKKELYRLVIVE